MFGIGGASTEQIIHSRIYVEIGLSHRLRMESFNSL